MREIYFHEDDYCQAELLPLTAKNFCLKQIGVINDFAEEHTGGAGFTDIYVSENSPHSLEELKIFPEKIAETLDFLPEFDKVKSEYLEWIPDSAPAFARGIDNDTAVFWEKDENGIISAMWLGIYVVSENRDIWHRILIQLGKLGLILADWCAGMCVDLTNPEEIENYLNTIKN